MIGISASKQAKLNNGQIANGYMTGDNAEASEGKQKREKERVGGKRGGGQKTACPAGRAQNCTETINSC